MCGKACASHAQRTSACQARAAAAGESAGLPSDQAVMTGQQCIAEHCPRTKAGNGDCAQQDSIRKLSRSAGAMHGHDIGVEPREYLHVPAVQTL